MIINKALVGKDIPDGSHIDDFPTEYIFLEKLQPCTIDGIVYNVGPPRAYFLDECGHFVIKANISSDWLNICPICESLSRAVIRYDVSLYEKTD